MPKPEKIVTQAAVYPKAPARDDSADLPRNEDGGPSTWRIAYVAGKEVIKVGCPCCGTPADASPDDVTKDNFLALTVICPSMTGCRWFGYVYLKNFNKRHELPTE
jgi:hypothetical protein